MKRGRASRVVSAVVATYSGTYIALSAVHALFPQRSGFLALSQVFAPHLALPIVALMALALGFAGRTTRVTAAIALVLAAGRFGPDVVSWPESVPPPAVGLRVMTWNLAAGEVPHHSIVQRALQGEADLIGLQELRPSAAAALETDPAITARFPYRLLRPERSVRGMGLLSRYPVQLHGASFAPPSLAAWLDAPGAGRVGIVMGHPLPADMSLIGGVLPQSYDTSRRDADIKHVRGIAEEMLAGAESMLLLGDFNVTDREPAYRDLSISLSDAHRDVGLGLGSTWRPPAMKYLPFGVLRIDYVFVGGSARAIATNVDCNSLGGDHCILTASVAFPPANGPRP